MKSTMIIITIRLLSQFKMASVLMFLLEPKIPKNFIFMNIAANEISIRLVLGSRFFICQFLSSI